MANGTATRDEGLGAEFYKVAEGARYLGISRSKLYSMMDAGEIPHAKFGKARRIPLEGLKEYAQRCLVPARSGIEA